MEKTNQNLLQKLTQILNVDKIISPEDIQAIRDALIGVLANNKKELESLTDETKQAVNSILDKVLTEHDTYLEKTKQIAQEAKSETTEAINSTLKSLEEVKALCKEVMECKPENGKDADEEMIIEEVLAKIKLPEYKEVMLDDGGQIVDKINSLPVNEENQIDAKHIKNLPEVKGGKVISGGVTRKIVEQMIAASSGSGDVVGPASATDNSVARYDGTTGKLIQDSGVIIDDSSNLGVGISPSFPLHVSRSSGGSVVSTQFSNTGSSVNSAVQLFLSLSSVSSSQTVGAAIRAIRTNASASGDSDLAFLTSTATTPTEKMRVLANGNLGLLTSLPTHTLTLASTSTGIALYNTVDQTTNYERGVLGWASNVLKIGTTSGGTGTVRSVQLYTTTGGGTSSLIFNRATTTGMLTVAQAGSATPSLVSNLFSGGNWTASSGTQTFFSITPTYAQTSTAGYTTLLVNPTETTTGSGTKLLADFQVGGSSKAKIDNTGLITAPQVITTPATVTVASNAGTVTRANRINNFTNSSAATMAVTLSTSGAVDGDMVIVRVYDFSAAAQTVGWTNTENSTISVPTTSNGSTTLPLTVGFMYNSASSKWRCVASC